jgi:hypothetical protein
LATFPVSPFPMVPEVSAERADRPGLAVFIPSYTPRVDRWGSRGKHLCPVPYD